MYLLHFNFIYKFVEKCILNLAGRWKKSMLIFLVLILYVFQEFLRKIPKYQPLNSLLNKKGYHLNDI